MPIIALTFDDGPNTVVTPQVLDILEQEGIKASFFLIARNITPESAEVVRRAKAMGCEIENHTVTHPFMDKLTVEEIRREVQECTDRIIEITGEAPKYFRPPFIALSQAMYDNIDLTFICGMIANAEDGQIVLLHDMQWNQYTVEALKTIIPELKKRGYEFATVSELFEKKHVTPRHGWLYTNVLQETSDDRL